MKWTVHGDDILPVNRRPRSLVYVPDLEGFPGDRGTGIGGEVRLVTVFLKMTPWVPETVNPMGRGRIDGSYHVDCWTQTGKKRKRTTGSDRQSTRIYSRGLRTDVLSPPLNFRFTCPYSLPLPRHRLSFWTYLLTLFVLKSSFVCTYVQPKPWS